MPTPQELRRVTLEEYIEANGGVLELLEGLASFAKDNGMDWKNQLSSMMTECEYRARFFQRMGVYVSAQRRG